MELDRPTTVFVLPLQLFFFFFPYKPFLEAAYLQKLMENKPLLEELLPF